MRAHRTEVAIAAAVLWCCAYFFQGGGWNQNAHLATAHAIVDEIHTPATRVIQQRLRLPEALLGPMQALWGHGDDREAAAMRVAWAAVRARISKVHFGHFAQAPEDLHRLGASEERVGQVLREALAELQARLPALGD